MRGIGTKIKACLYILKSRRFVFSVERKDRKCVHGWFFNNHEDKKIENQKEALRIMIMRLRRNIEKI